MEILEDKPGKQILLLGNEAITRGALEAGIDVATTYPGTPSSEIADTFSLIARSFTKQKKEPPFYFEYSTNEKVALEVAAAASFSGLRALTCMKHVGLNVASDAFMTYLYVGCRGGHIIVSADDPSCHSSQNEQDNRYFAIFGGAPMLEPSTPEEAKEMTRIGFEISEELKQPLLLRTTTRLNHARGPIELKKLQKDFPEKKLIIAGCIVDGDYKRLKYVVPNSSMVGTHYITKIVEVVNNTLKNKKLIFKGKRDEVKVCLPRVRLNKEIARRMSHGAA